MKTQSGKRALATVVASACIVSASFVPGTASADELFAYPPEGRSKQQQEKDRFECHQWAVEQSRFDPVQYAANGGTGATASAPASATATPAASTPAAAKGPDGRVLVGGAAQGAAIAAVSGGDVGDAAATGAGLGMLRAKRARRAAEEMKVQGQQQAQLQAQIQAQQQKAASAQDMRNKQQDYQRARGTCFRARGYTVSEG
jgi:hypothetical protein